MGKILLFYQYTELNDLETLKKDQRSLCEGLKLKGRILIATEGINGTLGGSDESCERYIEEMRKIPSFSSIDFKTSPGSDQHFPGLYIAIKEEIVKLGIPPHKLTPAQGGRHLTPREVHTLLSTNDKDLIVLDCRNSYESRIGTFKNSITPPIENFRDLPAYIDENIELFRNKKVLTHCTGGIRCERASAYLKEKGVTKEVYQIKGGIHRYVEEFPDGFFRGKNYVFDDRIALKVNDDILAQCEECKTPCDLYTNCINTRCNKQVILCTSCLVQTASTCSVSCKELIESKKVVARTKFRPTSL